MTVLLNDEQIKKLQGAGKKFPDVNETCIGCSACVAIADEAFTLDEQGMSQVLSLEDYDGKGVDDAISACPVNAISWKN